MNWWAIIAAVEFVLLVASARIIVSMARHLGHYGPPQRPKDMTTQRQP